MSSTRSRLLALGVLTLVVAGSGAVVLGTVCDFDPACGEPVDQSYELSREDEGVLSYGLAVRDGRVVAESADWTPDPPAPSGGDTGGAEGEVFLLSVHKNDIPLEPGIRHVLEDGNGTVTWNSGASDTRTRVGDAFRFTLYAQAGGEDVPLHRTKVAITR